MKWILTQTIKRSGVSSSRSKVKICPPGKDQRTFSNRLPLNPAQRCVSYLFTTSGKGDELSVEVQALSLTVFDRCAHAPPRGSMKSLIQPSVTSCAFLLSNLLLPCGKEHVQMLKLAESFKYLSCKVIKCK